VKARTPHGTSVSLPFSNLAFSFRVARLQCQLAILPASFQRFVLAGLLVSRETSQSTRVPAELSAALAEFQRTSRLARQFVSQDVDKVCSRKRNLRSSRQK
jgi:hypothetical protein